MGQELSSGFPRKRLDRIAEALRTVHRLLIEATKHEYERTHGPVKGPYALFALAAQDPAFAWLQPMTRLIVDAEDFIDGKERPAADADVIAIRDRAQAMIHDTKQPFGVRYLDLVHTSPDVAAEHGRLQTLLRRDPPGA